MIGEGAGIVILEELETARRRGAHIYCELVGYGMSGDAYHISAPCEDGDGAIRVMQQDAQGRRRRALGGRTTSTSTAPRRRRATRWRWWRIKRVFGDHARKLAISSTKSMTGHLLGAAGGLEAGITALALRDQVAAPTINYENPDPECDLDFVPNAGPQGRRSSTRCRTPSASAAPTARCCFKRFEALRPRVDGRWPHRLASSAGCTGMKIVVCVKQVPDTEARIRIAPDGKGIVESDLNWIVSPYDEFAIEEALTHQGGEGRRGRARLPRPRPRAVRAAQRPGHGRGLRHPPQGPAVRRRSTPWARPGPWPRPSSRSAPDLVLAGQQGVGGDNSQVPGLLAEILDLPQVTMAVKIEIGDGKATVEREIEGAPRGLGDDAARGRSPPRRGSTSRATRASRASWRPRRSRSRPRTRPRSASTPEDARAQDAGRRAGAAAARGRRCKMIEGDADTQVKELLRLLHEEAKVHLMAAILTFAEQRDGKLRRAVAGGGLRGAPAGRAAGRPRSQRSSSARASPRWPPSWRAYGADRVHVFDQPELAAYATEAYARALAQVDRRRRSRRSCSFPFTAMGKDLAPRVAARRRRGPRLRLRRRSTVKDGRLEARRPVYAGKAFATVRWEGEPQMATLRPNVFPLGHAGRGAQGRDGRRRTVDVTTARARGRRCRPRRAGKVELTEAQIIVSGGRGLKGPENFHLVEEPGRRPWARRWAPRARWWTRAGSTTSTRSGQTGKTVSPTLYVAAGISGAIQHLAGMSSSKVIVAINKDADAPIFKVANYGIVGDVFEILPKLTAAAEEYFAARKR